MTVVPSVWCTFEPARPFQVGPVEFWPLLVWQPAQLYFVTIAFPAATSVGVDLTEMLAAPWSVPAALVRTTTPALPVTRAASATLEMVVVPCAPALQGAHRLTSRL